MYTIYTIGRALLSSLIVVSFTIGANSLSAQIIEGAFPGNAAFTPSPDASSLGNFAATPVNLSSGTANISVPLTSLPTGGLQIPVALAYNSNGLKVSELSSSVGLGWSLVSGGVITRVVRDKPDDAAKISNGYLNNRDEVEGYAGPCFTGNYKGRAYDVNRFADAATSSTDFSVIAEKLAKNIWDSEGDIYYFSFLGRTGRFVLDENRQPVLIPQQDIKINHIQPEYILGSSNTPDLHYSAWIITTSDGTSYVFGNASLSSDVYHNNVRGCERTSVSTLTPYINDCLPEQTTTTTFASSWYLMEIISPQGNKEAIFEYKVGNAISYKDYTTVKYDQVSKDPSGAPAIGCMLPEFLTLKATQTTTIPNPHYISRIYSPRSGGEILFQYDANREDLENAWKLTDVEAKDNQGRVIQHKKLLYSYFKRQYHLYDAGKYKETVQFAKRLKLDQVKEDNIPPYQFTYNVDETLPQRNSPSVDYWGYYTSAASDKENTEGGPAIPGCTYTGFGIHNSGYSDTNPLILEGVDRSPNEAKMQACILKSILLPTGGSIKYEFGAHEYWNSVAQKNEIWGGIRIEKITLSDGIDFSKDIITTYEYTKEDNTAQSSGTVDPILLSSRDGKYSTDRFYRPIYVSDKVSSIPIWPFSEIKKEVTIHYLVRSSQPNNVSPLVSGGQIVYGCVTVRQNGQGKSVYRFTDFTEASIQDQNPELFWTENRLPPQDFEKPFFLKYMSRTSHAWRRGILTDVKVYDESGKRKSWKHLDYQWNANPGANKTLYGVNFYFRDVVTKTPGLGYKLSLCGVYKEIAEWYYLKQVTEKIYDQSDDQKFTETITEYSYNLKNLQVAQITQADGNGKKIISRYKYPVDYPMLQSLSQNLSTDANAPINELQRRHQIATVVESQVWQQQGSEEEKLLSSSITEFSFFPRNEPYRWIVYTGFSKYVGPKNTMLLPKRIVQLSTATPISVTPASPSVYKFSILNADGSFTYDQTKFTEEMVVNQYDSKGNMLEGQNSHDVPSCTIWDDNRTSVIAEVTYAKHNQVAYTSFEAYGDKGNWNYNSGTGGDAKIGARHFTGGEVTSNANLPNGKYKVSFWYKGSSVTINGASIPNSSNWIYYETTLTNPGKVTIVAGSAKLDELRLHPEEAFMTSYVHIPFIGLAAVTDPNGISSYYEYDISNRLKLIRDSQGRIIKTFNYHYHGQQP